MKDFLCEFFQKLLVAIVVVTVFYTILAVEGLV